MPGQLREREAYLKGEESEVVFLRVGGIMVKRRKLSDWVKTQVFKKQMGKCNHCGIKLKHLGQLDHIKPLMVCGTDDLDNLQYLCPMCHAHKTYIEIQVVKRCKTQLHNGELRCELCDTTYSKYFSEHDCSCWLPPKPLDYSIFND